MTPNDLGVVFSQLIHHREIAGNPPDRALRDGELAAANILADASESDLSFLDAFLQSQGFALRVIDGFDIGIPPRPGRPNSFYLLVRYRGAEVAPYIDKRWFIDRMRDNRSKNKTAAVFWLARAWLTANWFFYERIDRPTSDLSSYREALISEKALIETMTAGLEALGRQGRPAGDFGAMWDVLWETKESLPAYAQRFIRTMLEAGMIQGAGNPGEYHQTLAAAVDMAMIGEQQLAFLMPPKAAEDVDRATLSMVSGENLEENSAAT